jgi:hypothetical protein
LKLDSSTSDHINTNLSFLHLLGFFKEKRHRTPEDAVQREGLAAAGLAVREDGRGKSIKAILRKDKLTL